MNSNNRCHSCAMPIETGVYCPYCVDENGQLQEFEERVSRMSQFMKRENPSLSQKDLRLKCIAYMAQMPAWKDHPELRKALPIDS